MEAAENAGTTLSGRRKKRSGRWQVWGMMRKRQRSRRLEEKEKYGASFQRYKSGMD